MGSGASINDLPDVLTELECRGVAGHLFDEALFKSVAKNGTLSKEQIAQIMTIRTDCFLTHDWGRELGQDNHARVALVNAALQKRGLKTWFDAEKMQGNIKKQMISGIDNTQCVVVFVTKRYNEKVAGDDAEDNCQLEFNYAARRKTAVRMVSVVMEERMRNTREWIGEVAMVLGGRLYVDMCGDLSEPSYLSAKADELYAAIMAVIGVPLREADAAMSTLSAIDTTHASSRGIKNSISVEELTERDVSTHGAVIAGAKMHLEQLNRAQVIQLLKHYNMNDYDSMVEEHDITGLVLNSSIDSWNDLVDIGIKVLPAKALYKLIVKWREDGVPDVFQPVLTTTLIMTPVKQVSVHVKAGEVKHVPNTIKGDKSKHGSADVNSGGKGKVEAKGGKAKHVCADDGLTITKDARTFNSKLVLANQGNADAQCFVGDCYKESVGVIKNEQEAARYYKLAADQGHAKAQYNLARCYDNGTGVSKSKQEAVRYYSLAADQDEVNAQFLMGVSYFYGSGIIKNEQEAVRYYKMAASQGYSNAEKALGECYKDGIGVTKNLQEAEKYYKLAADHGDAEAKTVLKIVDYFNVDAEVTKEEQEFKTNVALANQGNAEAQYVVGGCYEKGTGIIKNLQEAVRYYKLAADQGHVKAQYNMGTCYDSGIGTTKNHQEAVRYFKLAADQDEVNAQFLMGLCYTYGTGVTKNAEEAVKYYKLAACQGYANAENSLGDCYKNGIGVTKNLQEAKKYYKLAADHGHAEAKVDLQELEKLQY